jgi:DNA adenine methylase
MSKSPLRYPGGKTRAINILRDFLPADRRELLSPFFGGGSFELNCASHGYTVYGNDLFTPLYTFWTIAKTRPEELKAAVTAALPVSKEKFLNYRKTILDLTDPLEIATAYFIVNRCSYSGSTFCGGYSSQAAEGRLNASAIERVGKVDLSRVTFSNLDAIEFLQQHPETENTLVYADPPYFIATYIYGKDGNMHEGFNHAGFAEAIRKRKDWILSYNDCPYIRELYAGCRIVTAEWAYGMDNGKKKASEIIILP